MKEWWNLNIGFVLSHAPSRSLFRTHPLCFSLCHFIYFFHFIFHFFFPVRSSTRACIAPSLPLRGNEGWLFVLQATSDLHPGMPSHFFWCFFSHSVPVLRESCHWLSECALTAVDRPRGIMIYLINNQAASAFSFAVNSWCPRVNSYTGRFGVVHHRCCYDGYLQQKTSKVKESLLSKSDYMTKKV